MAEVFTKALDIEKLRRFRSLLDVFKMDLSLRGTVEKSSSTPDVYLGRLSFMSPSYIRYTCGIVR